MKNLLFSAMVLFAGAVMAAEPTPKDNVLAAAKKLGDQPNYAWKTTPVVPEDAQFKPGPTDGTTEKDGFSVFKSEFGDNETLSVVKGDKRAATTQDGWKTLAELEAEEGFARFQAMILGSLKTPAKEAADLVSYATELKKDGEVIASDLTTAGATRMLLLGPARDGGPTVEGAKGSVKFWLKDGALTKYEFKLKGTIKFGDNEFPNDRTTTVTIKDVGTAKVAVPEEAKKKLS